MSHNINSVTMEINAVKEPVFRTREDGTEWGSVFALHNIYLGEEKDEVSIPLTVNFGGSNVNYARKAITQGTRFVVTGSMFYQKRDEKEFFSIQTHQLTVFPKKEAAVEA